jgi:hypothetical protein
VFTVVSTVLTVVSTVLTVVSTVLTVVSTVLTVVSTVLTAVRNLFSYVIEKILPTDRAFPTLFKQIQRKYFFDQGIEFVSISSVKVFFPTCEI